MDSKAGKKKTQLHKDSQMSAQFCSSFHDVSQNLHATSWRLVSCPLAAQAGFAIQLKATQIPQLNLSQLKS